MARPTTIKLGEGYVKISNLPKEKIEEIKKFLLTTPAAVAEHEATEAQEPIVDNTSSILDQRDYNLPMLMKTFSVHKEENTGKWSIVQLNYNADSKQAMVTEVLFTGDKRITLDKFRVLISKTFL